MNRLNRKLFIGVMFMFLVAASMWFAAPTFASMTQRMEWPAAAKVNGVYTERGTLIFEKRDINTNDIINTPGFAVIIFPNPYTLVPGSSLIVVDNVVVDGNYDHDSSYGYIKLLNVIAYSYTWKEYSGPDGYLIDPNSYSIDVQSGKTATAVSKDTPVERVPGSSSTGTWIMIGIFATLIIGLIWWRGRRSGFAFSGRHDS